MFDVARESDLVLLLISDAAQAELFGRFLGCGTTRLWRVSVRAIVLTETVS